MTARTSLPTKEVVIFGASGHAKVVIDAIESLNIFRIIGLIDRNLTQANTTLGYPTIGTDANIGDILASFSDLSYAIAIGNNYVRKRIADQMTINFPQFKAASIIHPRATVSRHSRIGKGCFIAAGATIGPDATIGDFAIINTNASIDHDVKIGEFASIAPGATIGGSTAIGMNSTICLGAKIVDNISIGKDVILGANSLALRDIDSCVVAYGSPAKTIRSNNTVY
jgi:sugar O-acyltransferase (sialic acid O-acetyltransferase NeuD family)